MNPAGLFRHLHTNTAYLCQGAIKCAGILTCNIDFTMHLLKNLLPCLLLLCSFSVFGQKTPPVTQNFTVEGLIKKPFSIGIEQIEQAPHSVLDSVVIRNHKGEYKSTLKHLEVVPLKTVLGTFEIDLYQPRLYSECYFVFVAADGYKVVFSWNELFNNPSGDAVYLIAKKNGVALKNMAERIALITPDDLMTGRRYIKGLSKIIIRRAE